MRYGKTLDRTVKRFVCVLFLVFFLRRGFAFLLRLKKIPDLRKELLHGRRGRRLGCRRGRRLRRGFGNFRRLFDILFGIFRFHQFFFEFDAFLFEAVFRLRDDAQNRKDDERVDKEGQNRHDEIAVVERYGFLQYGNTVGIVHRFAQDDDEFAEIAVNEQRDERLYDVVDEAVDDCRECGADDKADGKIDDVAARYEGFEILPERAFLSLFLCIILYLNDIFSDYRG